MADNTDYKGLNVTVVVYETQLLTQSDYNSMLNSQSLEDVLSIVEDAQYDISEDLLTTKDFDGFMMENLQNVYEEMYRLAPDPRVIDIMALRYVYHNLKVMLKSYAVDKDFSSMYIPIGRQDIDDLLTIVFTDEKLDDIHPVIEESVQEAKDYIEQNEDYDVLSVMFDKAYLKHISVLAKELDDTDLTKWVNMIIDFYNLLVIIRSAKQDRSIEALTDSLSIYGTIDLDSLLDYAEAKDIEGLLSRYSLLAYGGDLSGLKIEKDIDQIDVTAIEFRINELKAEYMREGAMNAFGPLPVMSYLFFKENEIDNIRLMLVGTDNRLSRDDIEERMRPIYDL